MTAVLCGGLCVLDGVLRSRFGLRRLFCCCFGGCFSLCRLFCGFLRSFLFGSCLKLGLFDNLRSRIGFEVLRAWQWLFCGSGLFAPLLRLFIFFTGGRGFGRLLYGVSGGGGIRAQGLFFASDVLGARLRAESEHGEQEDGAGLKR